MCTSWLWVLVSSCTLKVNGTLDQFLAVCCTQWKCYEVVHFDTACIWSCFSRNKWWTHYCYREGEKFESRWCCPCYISSGVLTIIPLLFNKGIYFKVLYIFSWMNYTCRAGISKKVSVLSLLNDCVFTSFHFSSVIVPFHFEYIFVPCVKPTIFNQLHCVRSSNTPFDDAVLQNAITLPF